MRQLMTKRFILGTIACMLFMIGWIVTYLLYLDTLSYLCLGGMLVTFGIATVD